MNSNTVREGDLAKLATPYGPHQMVALSEAICDPGYRPIYLRSGRTPEGAPTKVRAGWATSIDEAVRSGRPFCIKARRDVLVADDDSAQGLAETFAQEYLGELEPVLCASGRPGHRTLLCVVDDPAHRDFHIARAKEMGLTDVAYGRWIRPPGAPHTENTLCSALVGTTPLEATSALWRPHVNLPRLGSSGMRALYAGVSAHSDTTDKSDSGLLWSCTLSMVAAGWPESEMIEHLLRYPGGRKLQRKINAGDTREAALTWWRRHHLGPARSRVHVNPTVRAPSDAQAMVESLRDYMLSQPWKGAAGSTDRAVLGAILSLAERSSNVMALGLSSRQVAELAGLGAHTTATRSMKRLIKLGVLSLVPRHDASYLHGGGSLPANRYRLHVPPEERTQARASASRATTHQSYPGGVESTGAPRREYVGAHDAFRTGAVGKAGFKVWEALDSAPQTTKELALTLSYRSTGALQKQLRKLSGFGLASLAVGGWVRADGDLEAVAQLAGTAGRGDAQRALHKAQRSAATERLRKAQRRFSPETFIETHCVPDSEATTTYLDLLQAFRRWSKASKVKLDNRQVLEAVERALPNAPPAISPSTGDGPRLFSLALVTEKPVGLRLQQLRQPSG